MLLRALDANVLASDLYHLIDLVNGIIAADVRVAPRHAEENFLARIVSGMIARNNDGSTSQGTYFLVSMVLQIVFGFLASIIVMWFSRQREYRADAGAAKLVGAPKMIAALQRLKGNPSDLPQQMNAMGIASDAKDSLLSTHPSLENRIARLKAL